MKHYQPIKAAVLDWQDASPRSRDHGDIYFSTDGGIQETEYVFLDGNQLPQRWQTREQFTIAETGFGTGLNFLCTLNHWLTTAPPSSHLNYISAEKHPLTPGDLQLAIECWPELAAPGAELLKHYPALVHGLHQRQLCAGRVTLTLLFGDASAMYADLDDKVDAWYLDGFAPDKNPDMWTPELFLHIARLTAPGGSLATFSAAGVVRRGLQQAGFEISTQPGFGRKREMMVGQLTSPPQPHNLHPWFSAPENRIDNKHAIVIGAGLAGCTVSHALAERGWQVELIERHAAVAREASGNLAGVVMPRLTADMSPAGRFYLGAFLHTIDWLNRLKQDDPTLPWFQTGVIQRCDAQQQARMHTLELPTEIMDICDADSASQLCGIHTTQGGLYFPTAGWLDPPALCEWLLNHQHDRITTQLNQTALRLESVDNGWHVHSETGMIASADTLIIANGHDAEHLLDHAEFSLQKVHGQLVYLAANEDSSRLKMPVCHDGYIIPAHRGQHCAGASYDQDNEQLELDPAQEQQILAALTTALPEFTAPQVVSGRTAFRTTTLDHLPLIGPVPDVEFYQYHYADLRHGKPARQYPPARYLPNLFISAGHGSRGLVSCHYAATEIAARLNQDSQTMGNQMRQATHPARFLVRRLRRGL